MAAGLPEWCQTHSLQEFLELLEDYNKKEEKEYEMAKKLTVGPEDNGTHAILAPTSLEGVWYDGDGYSPNSTKPAEGEALVQVQEDFGISDLTDGCNTGVPTGDVIPLLP